MDDLSAGRRDYARFPGQELVLMDGIETGSWIKEAGDDDAQIKANNREQLFEKFII